MEPTFDRNLGIGGTDARLIMAGDWLPLWRQKTRREDPPDLSQVFRVQLGRHTEPFHLDWIARTHALTLRTDIPRQHAPLEPWRYITVDAWALGPPHTHVEVKHSHSAMTLRDAAHYYMPQLQHGLAITGADWCWFSVIPGNGDPMVTKVSRHEEYIGRLLELERTFWIMVQEDLEPDEREGRALATKAAALVPEILVGGFKDDLDMTRHNEWAVLAAEYLELKGPAGRFELAKKELKALVPEDRRRCFGGGIQITRDKRGQLILREEKL
jgi:predicted phage-related endonuclease